MLNFRLGWELIQNSYSLKSNETKELQIVGKKDSNTRYAQMVYRVEDFINIEKFL